MRWVQITTPDIRAIDLVTSSLPCTALTYSNMKMHHILYTQILLKMQGNVSNILCSTLFSIHSIYLFIYLGFYVAFNTVQVISRRVVGRAEETSTYSSLGLCTVNCRPTASNYQLSHLRPSQGSNPGLRGGRHECYHSATVAPTFNISYQDW